MTAPISPISAPRPVAQTHTQTGHGHAPMPQHPMARLPTPGETLSVTVNLTERALQAAGKEGHLVQLPAGLLTADDLTGDLQPGDVLLLKVLATSPRLELMRLGLASPSTLQLASNRVDQTPQMVPAMQPDQTAILRMNWSAPDAAALASNWQIAVTAQLKQAMSSGLQAELPNGAMQHVERWLLPVFAWGGLPLILQMMPPLHPEDPPPEKPPAWGVRIQGELPLLGKIEIQVQSVDGGVSLVIWVEQDNALSLVRGLHDQITQAVHRAGMSLVSFQCFLRPPPATVQEALDEHHAHELPMLANQQASTFQLDQLHSPIFRAAAEVLLTIEQHATASTSDVLTPTSR